MPRVPYFRIASLNSNRSFLLQVCFQSWAPILYMQNQRCDTVREILNPTHFLAPSYVAVPEYWAPTHFLTRYPGRSSGLQILKKCRKNGVLKKGVKNGGVIPYG